MRKRKRVGKRLGRRPARRTYRKSRRIVKRRRSSYPKGSSRIGLFPRQLSHKFRFASSIVYNVPATSLGATFMSFTANSPYKPVTNAVSLVSAYDWGKATDAYARYMCYASKITIKLMNFGNTALRCYLYPTLFQYTGATPPLRRQIEENRNVRKKIVNITSSGHDSITMSYYSTARQILQRSPQTDEDQVSVMTASPANKWYYNIFIEKMDQANLVGQGVICDIKIDYYCKLYYQDQELFPDAAPGAPPSVEP